MQPFADSFWHSFTETRHSFLDRGVEFHTVTVIGTGKYAGQVSAKFSITCNHAFTSTVTKVATCETAGTKHLVCSMCGYEYDEPIAALGHEALTDEAVPATCTTAGLTGGSHCSRCGKVLVAQRAVAAKDHDWSVVKTEADCSHGGVTVATCKACGLVSSYDYTAPTAHAYRTVSTVKATCEAAGLVQYECAACGSRYSEAIPALGHEAVADAAAAATCEQAGKTAGSHCSRCGKVLVAQQAVPALGHSLQRTVVAPMCVAGGHTDTVCTRCGYTSVSDHTSPVAHEYVAEVTKHATCQLTGERTYTCKACGSSYTEAIPKMDHIWGAWSVTVKPTTQSEGSMVRSCEVCAAQETKAIDKLDFDPAVGFSDVDPNAWYVDGVLFCAEKGLMTGYTEGEDAGKFGVGRALTRAQLVAILWRNAEPEAAAAYDGVADNATGMADVADNAWYTAAANWAVENEVVHGFDGVEFRPNDPVTAEQLVTILANYADPAGAEKADLSVLSEFADFDAVSDWARGSVAWAKAKGVINGYDEGGVRYLKPYEEIARERAATILMNAFESEVLK